MEEEQPPGWVTPPAIREMPDIDMFTAYYLNAFNMLSTSRAMGMGLGPIPLSEILSYCEFFEVEDPEAFIQVIQRSDTVYLELANEKSESKK